MDWLRRLKKPSAVEDMVYAYRKGMPLILTEMGMRQNSDNIGRFVQLQKRQWGAWLTLSVTNYIVTLPQGCTIRMYNAWGELQGKGDTNGFVTYFLQMDGTLYPYTLRSNTAVARVLVDVQYEEDGDNIAINTTVPLLNPYATATVESTYRSIVVEAVDPENLSGREYFSLLSTLVAANPTKDERLMRGLNYSDAAPVAQLERVRKEALGSRYPKQNFGAQ